MKLNLRLLYLYLFSFIGLLITVIGAIRLVDLGLKATILKDADKYEYYDPSLSKEEQENRQERELSRQRQRELSGSSSMIVVGLPLYLYHWNLIKRGGKGNKTEK